MVKLYVAAGGGGDAFAAAIVHRALGHTEPAIIATYAWDRLWIDPLPGPRSPADFRGLRRMGTRNFVLTPECQPRPPSRSTLPRLAAELSDTLALLDPCGGAVSMREQLRELVRIDAPDSIVVLDVGGDAVARGGELGLRSPLADALALAAAVELDRDVDVMVAGPGLDGELTEQEVLAVLRDEPVARLRSEDVERFRATLDWHPSEATALLAAAALGARGKVEIRDSGLTAELTDWSSGVFRLPLPEVIDLNKLAEALVGSSSLDEAERISREVYGTSEIDYERAKADRSTVAQPLAHLDLDEVLRVFEIDAASRNIDFVTFRRIAEAAGLPPTEYERLRHHLAATRPTQYRWPLWSVRSATPQSAP